MKILIAPDKFKGTLSAAEVAEAMAEGVRKADPGFDVELMPLADGGEGTAKILTKADQGVVHSLRAMDPMFRMVSCEYGIGFEEDIAFIDIAEASGLHRLTKSEYNPMRTTSLGTGEMAAAAMRARCKKIVIGLGGSATMDAGIGIMHGMGFRFRDQNRQMLSPIGSNLGRIAFIDNAHLHPRIPITKMVLLADVDNPLLGPEGALLYGAQKGLVPTQQSQIETGLSHFTQLVDQRYGGQSAQPGMGAAGGAAFACQALMGAKIENGAQYVLKALDFKGAMREADLVLTGEGRLDSTTLRGKVVAAVAAACAPRKVPVFAVAATVDLGLEALQKLGLTQVKALYEEVPTFEINNNTHLDNISQTVTEMLKNR
ncbi:MAG TPA: glycerate kinase [Bacteroidetes bacterium]|nr:glycerate kinase [Bacteroidota bacterium]